MTSGETTIPFPWVYKYLPFRQERWLWLISFLGDEISISTVLMCIGLFQEGQKKGKIKRFYVNWKNEVRLMVGSWNNNFITKSLDGVVRGLLCFPLIKSEVFRLHRHGNSLLPPSEVMAGTEKAVVECHISLDFSHTSAPKQDWTMSNTCLVQFWLGTDVWDKSVYSFCISLFFRMGSKATVWSMMSFSLSLVLACLGVKVNGNTNSMSFTLRPA